MNEEECQALYNFARVIEGLKLGRAFRRLGWNNNQSYIMLQRPYENSKMTRPYIFMVTDDGEKIPWVASQTDLLECDWIWYK